MRKILFLGCLCLLVGASGGCKQNEDCKENTDADEVRSCKAFVEIMVRQSACGKGEGDWEGASKEEQAAEIEKISLLCVTGDEWREEGDGCQFLNRPVVEEFAKQLREAGDCDAVLALEDPPDLCAME
ncbi:MAG: hypothetical protein FWG75_08150 [Cystobacterineae bacterium]|nr:hypothetical protein [Cystobacterineae bacterium]